MSARRGTPNARRVRPKDEMLEEWRSLEDPAPSEEFLRGCWEQALKRNPIVTSYDKAKQVSPARESIKCADVVATLDFLADSIGDDIFRTASLALRSYGLDKGGLKQSVCRLLAEHKAEPEYVVIWYMKRLVDKGKSVRGAAMLTAAHYGIPGQSFESVVKSLTLKFPKWKSDVESKAPGRTFPTGDTGRKLRVRLARPSAGADNPVWEQMGVKFDKDGFGIVPDDKRWRQLIFEGHVAHYGTIDGTDVGK